MDQSAIPQKAPQTEKKEPEKPVYTKVEKKKFIGKFHEKMLTQTIVDGPFTEIFQSMSIGFPTGINALPPSSQIRSTSALKVDEFLFKPMQDHYFGNYYVFSDSEDNTSDTEKKYKHIGQGFKNFVRQKKRQGQEARGNTSSVGMTIGNGAGE
jgi:hypothetical protein